MNRAFSAWDLIDRIPGALPQAEIEFAPLALTNTGLDARWPRTLAAASPSRGGQDGSATSFAGKSFEIS